MMFFCGLHHPSDAKRIERAFISANALRGRKSDVGALGAWIMDSGAFTTSHVYKSLSQAGTGGVYLMPVLQGYAPADYVTHVYEYGERLPAGAWVGVGSICKRNGNPAAIIAVLAAIKRERPDLRLHGFGLKTTSLQTAAIVNLLHSADSMAWSYRARIEGRNANCWREAAAFAKRIEECAADAVATAAAIAENQSRLFA